MQLVIKNGRYWADGAFKTGDIGIEAGRIAALGEVNADGPTLDASGLTVLPGLVDSHVHLREPGPNDSEDFFTGTRAAAAGGVTTVCEMPNVVPPVYAPEILRERVRLAEEKAMVDVAFYGAAGFANRHELSALWDSGVVALKTFLQPAPSGRESDFHGLTVADDGELLLLLREAARLGYRVMFHCENYQVIACLERELKAAGVTENAFHYLSRPAAAEVESAATVLTFAQATGAKVGICHISLPQTCALVQEARAAGVDVLAETCWHYLFFDQRDIDRLGPFAKCNPPLRTPEAAAGLWPYLQDGTIDMIGSDHAPHWLAAKQKGVSGPIWQAPSGIPSIEVMLPMLLTQVNAGRITLEQLVRLTAENASRALGLYPQKGCLAVGSDADLTLVDLGKKYTLDKNTMKTKAKEVNLLFDGLPVQGRPEYTLVRGQIVMAHGEVKEQLRGWGRYVRRR